MHHNPNRKSKTESEMFPIVEQWLASGQEKNLFCREHNIPGSLFNYWASKYKWARQQLETSSTNNFVAIEVKEQVTVSQVKQQLAMEWNMADGSQLKIYHPVDVALVRSLINGVK